MGRWRWARCCGPGDGCRGNDPTRPTSRWLPSRHGTSIQATVSSGGCEIRAKTSISAAVVPRSSAGRSASSAGRPRRPGTATRRCQPESSRTADAPARSPRQPVGDPPGIGRAWPVPNPTPVRADPFATAPSFWDSAVTRWRACEILSRHWRSRDGCAGAIAQTSPSPVAIFVVPTAGRRPSTPGLLLFGRRGRRPGLCYWTAEEELADYRRYVALNRTRSDQALIPDAAHTGIRSRISRFRSNERQGIRDAVVTSAEPPSPSWLAVTIGNPWH